MAYTVLLTTSGTGSRLGELTKDCNKALVKIGDHATIDYLLDCYPADTRFVITLGYLGEQVRQYLTEQHPDRNFEFVTVDPYEGPGSSLGYSLLCAKDVVTEPFIFHACDTVITQSVPAPDRNWVAGFKMDDSRQYRTLNIQDGSVILINDKGADAFDYIHIGLVGVAEPAAFWQALTACYEADVDNQALNDTDAINTMLKNGHHFDFVTVDAWYDTGNPEALARTAGALGNTIEGGHA